jgi:DNA-binding SARP family transcriptional activator
MAELVAYLATHRPSVSGERIRLALWPASTDDERFGERSSRTLWALTTRARQALGRDADGESLLQRDEHNTLALSPLVGCDWVDFQDLVVAARTDPGRAVEHLNRALSLVRGTPFQDVRAGYAWVEFEHLACEIDSVVADAALDLTDLGLADGDLTTARFAVRKGLLGCPSSEPLLRAAMRVAHAAGERAGVERAWRDIERLAGEYGAEPEPESAALYQSLRRTSGPA